MKRNSIFMLVFVLIFMGIASITYYNRKLLTAAPILSYTPTSPTLAIATETPNIPSPTPTPKPENPFFTADVLTALSAQAGWNVLAPSVIPEGYTPGDVSYLDADKQVVMTFLVTRSLPGGVPALTETKTLTLVQSTNVEAVVFQLPADAAIKPVTINDQPGGLVHGAWDSQFDQAANSFSYTWREDLGVTGIYWQAGDIHLALISNDDALNDEQLVQIAEQVR